MERTFVQVYEVQTPEEARRMTGLGVDRVGSVLVSAEKWKDPAVYDTVRAVQEAGAVSSLIPLFSAPDAVLAVVDHYRPDILHLCDALCGPGGGVVGLAPHLALQEAVRKAFPDVRIMRTIPVAPPGRGREVDSLGMAREFAPLTDIFLTDTWFGEGDPVLGYVGITGRRSDWDVATELVEAGLAPVVLAGGLGPENVREGVLKVRPAGVDSCTRTNAVTREGKPIRFLKDSGRVRRFVEETRAADRILAGRSG